jgi:hypothetical protein
MFSLFFTMFNRVFRVTVLAGVVIFPTSATSFANHNPSLAQLATLPLARIAREVYPGGRQLCFRQSNQNP